MRRERLELPDGDFVDLDFAETGRTDARGLAILSHGLEGDSGKPYIQGMARALMRRGWDVLAWNFRGCSGEPNRLLRSYHSGETGDIAAVVAHVMAARRPERLALVGFSLGANVTLKFVGEQDGAAQPRLWRAVAISVPCDLASGAAQLARRENSLYMRRFLRTMVRKAREKRSRFPHAPDTAGAERMRTFAEFDERFTAPIHGFAGARDYWRRSSSRPLLGHIRVPTLIINARNDPFLSPECFPLEEAARNPAVHLEVPSSGGHVGFVTFGAGGEYWSETRAAEFLDGA
jgi:predicted alpha/beta-fold hydrolase